MTAAPTPQGRENVATNLRTLRTVACGEAVASTLIGLLEFTDAIGTQSAVQRSRKVKVVWDLN